jgi:3,8-divinyl protochlorophyllide a 8-vinyl-reductase (ferredoxin)
MSTVSNSTVSASSDVHRTSKETLCSSCGLCSVKEWPSKESIQSCVFKTGWLGAHEARIFGRERSLDSFEEMRFGISKSRFTARMKQPIPDSQWTGIITQICLKAFQSGLVEGVVTLHRSEDDIFIAEPVLAQTAEDILAARGNKPVLASTLSSLEHAYRLGMKHVLVVGAACHVHVLRDFQHRHPYLNNMDIFVIGIPCTDNVKPKKLRWILERISSSHTTVRHYEFMQDFNVHLKHENGRLEKVPYFSLPQELSQNGIFAPSCMSCFDYVNSLADITVGYLGAPFHRKDMRQWMMIRTEKGQELYNLIANEIDTFPEVRSGNAKDAVKMNTERTIEQMKLGSNAPVKTGRRIPILAGKVITAMMSRFGPKGLEFARYSIDFHLMRNYYYVKLNYPNQLHIIPKHVYKVLEEYEIAP